MSVAMEDRLPGASVREKETFGALRTHERDEQELIDSYSATAAASTSLTVRYLIEMIVEDERRHHRLMGELANTVRAYATLEEVRPRLPFIDIHPDRSLLMETRRFLAHERRDRRALKKLSRNVRYVGDESDSLVVDLMRLDTERHIKMLRFIARLVRRRGN